MGAKCLAVFRAQSSRQARRVFVAAFFGCMVFQGWLRKKIALLLFKNDAGYKMPRSLRGLFIIILVMGR